MSESVWSDGGPAFHSTLQLPGQRGFSLSMLVEYSGGVGGGTASPHVPPADFERAVWTRMVVGTQICLFLPPVCWEERPVPPRLSLCSVC